MFYIFYDKLVLENHFHVKTLKFFFVKYLTYSEKHLYI